MYVRKNLGRPKIGISNFNNLKVLTEVRDAPRTLKRSAPSAVFAVTLLYILANIAYVKSSVSSWRM